MRRFVHRVTKNETIDIIETKYNVSKNWIYKLNNINKVYEGQWLLIEQHDGIWHVVQPFETIQSIAMKYKCDEKTIKKDNEIDEVFIGMKLFIKK